MFVSNTASAFHWRRNFPESVKVTGSKMHTLDMYPYEITQLCLEDFVSSRSLWFIKSNYLILGLDTIVTIFSGRILFESQNASSEIGEFSTG